MTLLYYFFIHFPAQKKNFRPTLSKPTTQNQTTQTDPTLIETEPGPEISPDPEELKKLTKKNQELLQDQAQKERTIIGLNQSYDKLNEKFTNLKSQLTKLTQEQTTEAQQTELALDQLIKALTKLNQEIE